MSISAPASYPPIDLLPVPDADLEVKCPLSKRLTCQIANQTIYITFGQGIPNPIYGPPEPYFPFIGQLVRDFDAIKIRAYIPAAQLPAGSYQARALLIPITTDG